MSGDDIGIVRRMCEGGNGVFHDACLAVCDEVERLRAEVERLEAARVQLLDCARGYMDMVVEERDKVDRLRAAGDTLAIYVRAAVGLHGDLAAIDAWEEARRG